MMLAVIAGRRGMVAATGAGVDVGIMTMVIMIVGHRRRMLVRRHAAGRFPTETRRENRQQHDHNQQAGYESRQHLDSKITWTNYTITHPA
jgi:hypothetical protein